MKRSVKILVSALLLASMSLTALPMDIPAVTQTASAVSASTRGVLENGFTWEWDENTSTLTIEGNGQLPADLSEMASITGSSPGRLVLGDGITGFSDNTTAFSPTTLVLGQKFSDTDFTAVKPTESFEVSSRNRRYLADGGGLYTADGRTLLCYAAGEMNITLRDGTRKVSTGAFYGCKAETIIIPETVTDISPEAFQGLVTVGNLAVVLPNRQVPIGYPDFDEGYNLFFFYTLNGEPACEGYCTDSEYLASGIGSVWALLGYRTAEEIYGGETGPVYGFRFLTTIDGPTGQAENSVYYATWYGVTGDAWVYADGKVYRILGESASLTTTDGTYTYFDAAGEEQSGYFTFADDGSVIDPPADLKVTIPDAPSPIPLWIASGNAEVSPGGYTGLFYWGGTAYIYDENRQMLRSGWYQADGDWFYLSDYGSAVVNCWRLKDGKYRYLKSDGRMAHDEWIQDYGYWYYCKSDGTRYESSWAQIGGKWYWFGGSGKMMVDGWLTLADGNTYYFYADGHMAANTTIDGHRVNGSGVRVS